GGGLQLKRVIRSGPAERAGLMVGDELIAVSGWRLHQPEDLTPVLAALQPGAELEVAYARDGRLRFAQLQAAPAQVERWSLEPDRQATAAAVERRRRWLCLELP
nr:PDZ domain-containing protein [Cyanobacteriota bacterium]